MEQDLFSELSKKATGLDMAFALTSALWLIGTATAFYEFGSMAFAVVIPLWSSLAGFYYLTQKFKPKSTWSNAVVLFLLLQIWKAFLVTIISLALA